MQIVMRCLGIHSRRIIALLGLGALLSGCAAWQVPFSPPPPASGITANNLKTSVHDAYHQGFEAGRHYQRELDWRYIAAEKAALRNQKPEPASALPESAAPAAEPTANQPSVPSAALSATPSVPAESQPAPLPPATNYTTSGPAQPLQ